jgi:hypothetical protein
MAQMFKVLVISYYFPPMGLSGVQRVLKFVKYMKDYNWEPTVITTGNPKYYSYDKYLYDEAENLKIRILRTEHFNPDSIFSDLKNPKMSAEFIRKIKSRICQTFFIPDNKKGWSKKVFFIAKNLLEKEKFDIIFVSGPPFSSFIVAAKLSQMFDISLFVDYRDLWTNNPFGFIPSPLHKYLHKKKEYYVLKTADKIITVNRKIKEKIINTFKFLNYEDVMIIPHGYDIADFANVTPEPKLNSKLKLLFTGVFYEYFTPKYFLKAFKELTIERPDVAENIELHFAGQLRKENKKIIRKLGLIAYIKDHGLLDHEANIKKIISSDILWFMVGRDKNSDSISTGKLFEYIGSGKPIIACVPDGAAKSAAQEYGAAFITEPDDIIHIKETLIEVYNLYKEGNLPKPKVEFVDKHRRDFLTEQLTKQFQFYLREL